MTGGLVFRNAKAGLVRGLIAERTDPVLFALSYDYVGDLSETVALMWPSRHGANAVPHLPDVVEGLRSVGKTELPRLVASWLDHLDETGRWALLKLITGSLRIGVSARLAKTAVAALGGDADDEVELVWPGLTPPYDTLFAWVEGRGERPEASTPRPSARPCSPTASRRRFRQARPRRFRRRMEVGRHPRPGRRRHAPRRRRVARLYSRTGEDISAAFPDLVETLPSTARIDGELLVLRESRGAELQRPAAAPQPQAGDGAPPAEFPAHIRAYDLLFSDGNEDLRERPFSARRAILEDMVAEPWRTRASTSRPSCPSRPGRPRRHPPRPRVRGRRRGCRRHRGLMIKRRDSPYLPGRPKGPWWKWKRDPMVVDCVLMYAQRGHGKRSSFYSDFTFGVWRDGPAGDELVPVGKAYFGFTDEELGQLDRFVRNHTLNRFGPVREVTHTARERPGAGDRLRGAAALDPPQVRRRHALSPHLPDPLGQAAGRGRPHRGAGGAAAAEWLIAHRHAMVHSLPGRRPLAPMA
jgi:DNA ligase-1